MRTVPLVGMLLVALGAASCGPSLRMLHESTVYFERCHAAEFDDAVPIEQKLECWNRWMRWYSAEQTETRLLYAQERIVYLTQGELVNPLPDAETARVEEAAAPAPVSADTRPARPLQRLSPRTTGHPACAPACRPEWDACTGRCDPEDRGCVAACQNRYASCMDGCMG